jgi:choline monooxygenase
MSHDISAGERDAALGVISDAVLEKLDAPIEEVRGLPNEAFTSEAFFELEKNRLFPRTWTFAGAASDISDIGDAQPAIVAGHPVILVRQKDGCIGVFHNVCPHRGSRLLTEPVAGERAIVCPYHAWSFELDGQIRGRTHYHGCDRHETDPGLSGRNDCLIPVRSHTFHDWVFVNLDGQAPSFEDYVGTTFDCFDGYALGSLERERHITYDIRCNWKLAIENFCDFYHVFNVHPVLDRAFDKEHRRGMFPDGRHLFGRCYVGGRHGMSMESNETALPYMADLGDEQKNYHFFISLFPNFVLNLFPTNIQGIWFEPTALDHTVMHMWFYYTDGIAEAEQFRSARDEVVDEWLVINGEDADICHRLQLGRESGAYDGGHFAPYWDEGTVNFHKQVALAIRGEGAYAAAG